jgi:hypothetical protein
MCKGTKEWWCNPAFDHSDLQQRSTPELDYFEAAAPRDLAMAFEAVPLAVLVLELHLDSPPHATSRLVGSDSGLLKVQSPMPPPVSGL